MSENRDERGGREAGAEHHHRKRKSLWRRFKHKVKRTLYRKKWLIPITLISLVLLVGAGLFLRGQIAGMAGSRVTAAKQMNVGSGYRNITYKGKEYRYNSRITSVLYVGVDSEGELKTKDHFGAGANADSISLVVMDEFHRKMTIIAINRNTICKIHRYGRFGHDFGEFVDQLCLSFAYGDNGPMSCWNLRNSVSQIMYGIPINEYVITNRSSLPEIMRVLGNITVTVPNNDLADKGFIEGESAIINTDNVETFVRYRDTNVDFSNVGRMERQRAFINGAMETITELLDLRPNEVWRKIEAAEYCVQTNITRSRYLDLTKAISNAVYTDDSYYVVDGKSVAGPLWDEFYVDNEKLLDKIVEIFYIEK